MALPPVIATNIEIMHTFVRVPALATTTAGRPSDPSTPLSVAEYQGVRIVGVSQALQIIGSA